MNKTAQLVLEETERFEQALPQLLLTTCAGKWVVFKDGSVVSTHDTEAEAYDAGIATCGIDGGHVVAKVAPLRVRPLRAAVLYS